MKAAPTSVAKFVINNADDLLDTAETVYESVVGEDGEGNQYLSVLMSAAPIPAPIPAQHSSGGPTVKSIGAEREPVMPSERETPDATPNDYRRGKMKWIKAAFVTLKGLVFPVIELTDESGFKATYTCVQENLTLPPRHPPRHPHPRVRSTK